MFFLLRKARSLQLPIDLQLHLFDKNVSPVILYGCEVCLWGLESCSDMIYGELGVIPISIQAKCRLLNFWAKLVNGTECKLSKYILFIIV